MSSTGDFSTTATITPMPVAGAPAPLRTRVPRTRRWLAGAVAAAVVAVGLLLALAPMETRLVDRRPVVLPAALLGLAPSTTGQFADDAWRAELSPGYGGATVDGRAYDPGTRLTPRVNLMVARGRSDDSGDVRLGHEPHTEHGDVRCTRTFQLDDTDDIDGVDGLGEPFASSTMLLCFRETDELTVSILGSGAGALVESDVAAAVDEVWALQQ